MQSAQTKPVQWPKSTGLVTMTVLRRYASWLFPQIGRKWQAEGVTDFTQKPQPQSKVDPYQFPKNGGPVMIAAHFKSFAAYVFEAIGPQAKKDPYKWPKNVGALTLDNLKHFNTHVVALLARKHAAA